MINGYDDIYLMLFSLETFVSHFHGSDSNLSSLTATLSTPLAVNGSNLEDHSHIVPLLKFNYSAASSGVWAERWERKKER